MCSHIVAHRPMHAVMLAVLQPGDTTLGLTLAWVVILRMARL